MLLDPSTAEGEFLAKMLSAVAQIESALKSQRLLMHYEERRTSGTFQAPPGTFGYLRENVVDWEAQLIREAYEAIDAGKTMGSIAQAARTRAYRADQIDQWGQAPKGPEDVSKPLTPPREARDIWVNSQLAATLERDPESKLATSGWAFHRHESLLGGSYRVEDFDWLDDELQRAEYLSRLMACR